VIRFAIALVACLALVVPPGDAQVGAGCTPESMASQKAGSLPTPSVGRWNCYAVNYGPTAAPFSLGLFALTCPELHLIAVERVKDIVQVKQGRSWTAITIKILSYALLGATLATGTGVITTSAQIVSRLALATVSAREVSQSLSQQVPPLGPFTGDLLSPQFTTLGAFSQPGYWITWTAYASKTPLGNQAIGPRWIAMPGPAPAFPALPLSPPGTNQ
jgi:hypothetical protein